MTERAGDDGLLLACGPGEDMIDLYVVGGRGGGVLLKLGASSRGDPTMSGKSSLKYGPSGVLFPAVTNGEVTPVRCLHSAGSGGTGLVGAGEELYSANCSTSSSRASSSRQTGGK